MSDLFGSIQPSQPVFTFPASLASRYQPHSIDSFIGLSKPKQLCRNLAANPKPIALRFVGPSGTGKTTLALALAESIPAEIHHIPSQECNLEQLERVSRTCQYFSECNGFTVELIAGMCPACNRRHQVTRKIAFTPTSKPHICNAKCISAQGPNCECSCGGKNHGAGFIPSGMLFGF
jgi:hypothetical protein